MKNKEMIEVEIYKTVKNCGGSGIICLPKFLIGQEIKILFKRKLTEDEKNKMKLYNLKQELIKIKEKKK